MSLTSTVRTQQSGVARKAQVKVSIIIPVLNEGECIVPFLKQIRERAPAAELIVVNAAGSQNLPESAIELCDQVLTSRRGRAAQMNAGAAVAGGEVFWFVHADCVVPRGCLEEIVITLQERHFVGGCFRIRFPRRNLIYRVSDAGGNLAVEMFGRCYGDHGIFCRRDDFLAVGGYPDVPVLEDAEFYRLLGKRGAMRQLSSHIRPSPRRYEELGPYRLTAAFVFLSTLYILRVPIAVIARLYQRLCAICGE